MALFGRKPLIEDVAPAITVVESRALALGDLPCSERGCSEMTGLACEYTDRRGRECSTAWCPAHRVVVDARSYCRRHAGVTRALAGSETPTAPDVRSRAASLAAWVASDLTPQVVALLQEISQPGEQLRVQVPRLVFVGVKRTRSWEHAWKLTRHTGISHWVGVHVPEEQDDQVHLVVDGIEVKEGIPPWIAARRDGRPLEADEDVRARQRYYAELVEAVAAALRRGAPRH